MIVDDTLKNCLDCAKVGITPIWIRTKYNESITDFPKDLLHTKSWDFVDSVVQQKMAEMQGVEVRPAENQSQPIVECPSNRCAFNSFGKNAVAELTEADCM